MTSHASTNADLERGNTLILSIALSAIAIALVLTFATITQIHLERKRLFALTDSAALYAASAIDEWHYYTDPAAIVPLTDRSVRSGVASYLGQIPGSQSSRFHGLTVASPTGSVHGRIAQVTLAAYVQPGYIPWGIIPFDGFYIETTSTAHAN